jgi:phosphocarrier protein
VGLHARPAAVFVQAAKDAPGDVRVAKTGGESVNAKSILSVLALDVRGGEEIVLSVEGDDSEVTLDRLVELVARGDE